MGPKKSKNQQKPKGFKSKVNKPKDKFPRKLRPSLKQQQRKESKIVRVDNLLWKPVEIPDNLESYEGFFGLEEIDGVDVEVVNGKAQFKVKDESKIKEEPSKDASKKETVENLEEKEDGDEIDEDADEEEFTGFDDDDVADSDHEVQIEEEDLKEATGAPVKKEKDQLAESLFSSVDLPEDVKLPHWEFGLSNYSLIGLNALGFKSPTPIQKKSIPLAMQGKDIIGKATTGSGKTLAYGIPILEKYCSNKPVTTKELIAPPTGIIFVPTRELAHQVVDHLNKLSKYFPFPPHGILSITGGLSIQKQERLLKLGPGVIVATPGRCLELLEKDEELIKRLASTDTIVLDEADRLLQDGHFDEFERILDLFRKNRPKTLPEWKWQTLVFSATFARDLFGKLTKHNSKKSNQATLVENDEILKLLNEKLHFKDKKPVLIDANPKEIVSGQVTEALVECAATERDLYLYYFLLVYEGSTLVFANSIDSVKRLVPFLNNLGIPAFAIHSSMIQKQRLRALERFKAATEQGKISVLVASDVAARGLDIPNIDHVAHYHLPRSADIYIHRSGRTARAGNEGVSVMFCSPQEASGPLKKLRKLVAANVNSNSRLNMHTDVKLLPIEDNLVSQLKPRVKLSSQLAEAAMSANSTKKENSWMKQAADDLGIDDLADIDDFEDDIIKRQRVRIENKSLDQDETRSIKYELKSLLRQPIRKLNRRSYLTSGLQNLAHIMVTGNTHKDILGHKSVNALQDLQGKNYKGDKNKVTKGNKKVTKDNKNKVTKDKKVTKKARK